MKNLWIALSFIFAMPIMQVMGAGLDTNTILPENYIGYIAILSVLAVVIVVMLILLRTFNLMGSVVLASAGYRAPNKIEEKPSKTGKNSFRERPLVYGLAAMMLLLLINYCFTGSTNKMPLVVSVVNTTEPAKAENVALTAKAGGIDETNVQISVDASVLSSGKSIFQQKCAPCHGDKGQGVVGPNLTDDFWLHGGKITDVFKVIKYGVPTTAMAAWQTQLTPQQISDVANFIKSINGTNPPGAKAPQGNKEPKS
jgi:cytochrome c oxidase cbb3-type subunit 3